MTTARWFTQREHGGFPIEKAALGGFDLSVVYVGGNGNGWLSAMAATWPKVRRGPASLPATASARTSLIGCATGITLYLPGLSHLRLNNLISKSR
jgi:hypothetical protein